MAAEGADPRLGPAIAPACRLAGTIEKPRDLLVGHQPGELPDQRQGILWNCPAMLACGVPLYLQGGMIASLPMQDHLDEAAFDAHDDLAQGGTNNPLARCRCRRRMRPGEFQIGAEPHQALPLRPAYR